MSLKTMYVSYFLIYEDAGTVMLLSPSNYKKTHIQLQSNLRICIMLSPSLLISTEIGCICFLIPICGTVQIPTKMVMSPHPTPFIAETKVLAELLTPSKNA